jgi:hypothetical protein
MKRLIAPSLLGAVLAMSFAGMTGTHAQTATATATPVAPPVQGNKMNVVLTADTVQGAGGQPAATVGCSMTNLFRQGQVVVFRMWGINVKDGGVALTSKNVKSATITIPGVTVPVKMVYSAHGTAPNAVSFWAAPWNTKGYTLGEVDFSIVVKTKADTKNHVKAMTATYNQQGFAQPSRLTITP